MIYSCQKEDDVLLLNEESTNQAQVNGMMKLGKKLENPYSVENMQKALDNIKKSNVTTNGLNIETTHLYIKFIPKNEDELSVLKRDSTFVLYDHPLDYEIKENGNFYRDPEVQKGQPTYQYCAVRVDKKLPIGIKSEILAELFIPDEDKDHDTKSKKIVSNESMEALVDEALRITNNLPNANDEEQKSGFSRKRKWKPAGTIRVWDGSLSRWVGVEGVEVRARRWFTTHKGIANSNGYYSCDGDFRRDANYSIDWERYNFALQDGWLNGATYNGPKKRGNWDLNLNSGEQEYYATIFRAAYHYYYKDIKGLRRPPKNGTLKTQLKIRAYLQNLHQGNVLGNHKEERRFLGAQIKIFTYTRPAIDTYSTVIHELAHASHWNMWRKADDFDDTESRIKESWAAGVEWSLSRLIYPQYNRRYNNKYTGVVVDMIDGIGGLDQVSGYTERQIEDALKGEKSWNSWRDNIKNKYNNPTENHLNALFDRWDN